MKLIDTNSPRACPRIYGLENEKRCEHCLVFRVQWKKRKEDFDYRQTRTQARKSDSDKRRVRKCLSMQSTIDNRHPVMMALRIHLFPYRTQKLSSIAPMVLGGRLPGRVGRCRIENSQTSRHHDNENFMMPESERVQTAKTIGKKLKIFPYSSIAQLAGQPSTKQPGKLSLREWMKNLQIGKFYMISHSSVGRASDC